MGLSGVTLQLHSTRLWSRGVGVEWSGVGVFTPWSPTLVFSSFVVAWICCGFVGLWCLGADFSDVAMTSLEKGGGEGGEEVNSSHIRNTRFS